MHSSTHPNAVARFDLTGLVAWVPGGTGLLGRAICRALAEHGALVVVSSRRLQPAQQLAEVLRTDGLRADAVQVDVSDEGSVDEAVAEILDRHQRLDCCVNLAYSSTGKEFDDLTAADWQSSLSSTATGAFLVGRAAGRAMATGGSIVQFGSMYGLVSPDPRNYPPSVPTNPPDYGFAKAGILQLVRYQAVQLGPRGVRVNAIVPGPFPGDTALSNEGFGELLSARVPLGRTGRPEELTAAVVFLCSASASFMTGASIVIDGGWTAW